MSKATLYNWKNEKYREEINKRKITQKIFEPIKANMGRKKEDDIEKQERLAGANSQNKNIQTQLMRIYVEKEWKIKHYQKNYGRWMYKKEAVKSLGITTRQIDRLILRYQNEWEIDFIHKSRGKESKKKLPENIKDKIINLDITEYFDYNFTHFYEEIMGKYKLSRKTISTILSEADISSPEAQHKTVTLYNANMKKAIRQKEATNKQITIYKKARSRETKAH